MTDNIENINETEVPEVVEVEQVVPTEQILPTEEKELESFVNENNVVISRRDLDDEEIREKRAQVEAIKIQRDKVLVDLKKMEKQLEEKIPSRFLEDDIDKVKKAIETRKLKDEDLTDADIADMQIHLDALQHEKELDIKTRELRLRISQTKRSLEGTNNPERQIKILEKQIREKKENFVSGRAGHQTGSYIN